MINTAVLLYLDSSTPLHPTLAPQEPTLHVFPDVSGLPEVPYKYINITLARRIVVTRDARENKEIRA